MPGAMIAAIVFIFGLFIGSFLNVCIYRLPRKGMLAGRDLPGSREEQEAIWQALLTQGLIDADGMLQPTAYAADLSGEQLRGVSPAQRDAVLQLIKQSQYIAVDKPKRSFCPHCHSQIAWFDNIPLISYLSLIGKCRSCHGLISGRYFLVELLTGLVGLTLYQTFGLSAFFFVYSLLSTGLIVATFVDFEFQIIPDEISVGGLAVGVILSLVFPQLHQTSDRFAALLQSALGIVAGGGSIWLIGKFGELVFRKESMGGGDVKLMAMIGSVLGWQLAILIFFLEPCFGAVVGIIMRLRHGAEVIPYGPYLSLATFLVMLRGAEIIRYYFPIYY